MSFLLSSNERISLAPFFDLHHTTQSCIVLASSSHVYFSLNTELENINLPLIETFKDSELPLVR